MTLKVPFIGIAAALLATAACNQGGGNDAAPADVQSSEAKKLAGDKTISAGLAADSKFLAAAKSAGLDQTLAGPGPYTVFVPSDAAFAGAPAGSMDDGSSEAGYLRLGGALHDGAWSITSAFPAVDAATLEAAIALAREAPNPAKM